MVSFYLFLPFLKINKTFRHIQVKHIILQSAVTFPPHSQESHKALSSNQKTLQGSHGSLPLAMRTDCAAQGPLAGGLFWNTGARGRAAAGRGSWGYVVWKQTQPVESPKSPLPEQLVTLGALEGTGPMTGMSDGSEPCEAPVAAESGTRD